MTNSNPKPSRPVTRARPQCVACGQRFSPTRKDQRYCSPRCRQRSHRARSSQTDRQRQIDATRRRYWQLVADEAAAQGAAVSRVVTALSQFVDADGNVYMGGDDGRRLVGHVEPDRPGWSSWGLEAAGPPWSPPTREG